MARSKKSPQPDSSTSSTLKWYEKARPQYEGLTAMVCGIVESLIKDAGIDYLSVTSRTKLATSLADKIKTKGYRDPKQEIHDFSGIRATAYLESEVRRISELVKKSFRYHPDKSLDKTSELGVDRMGYRSIHLVCDLGDDRCSLPEYASCKGLLFEIQVRTVLQHAWAEIEHDRSYKFAGILPEELRRRFFVAAGTLELVDREFDAISQAMDEYTSEVAAKAERGELDIELNTTSLAEFIRTQIPFSEAIESGYLSEEVIAELHDVGIDTLRDLKSALSDDFIESYPRYVASNTDLGFLRSVMMYADLDRYFEFGWKEHWRSTSTSTNNLLAHKYGAGRVGVLFEARSISVVEE